jgi:hypothetical protein
MGEIKLLEMAISLGLGFFVFKDYCNSSINQSSKDIIGTLENKLSFFKTV